MPELALELFIREQTCVGLISDRLQLDPILLVLQVLSLSLLVENGLLLDQTFANRFPEVLRAASRGHPIAQFLLPRYFDGES